MIIALQALYLFQKSLLAIFEQILEPYLKNIFYKSTDVHFEEDSDDDVYSEFDEDKGVVFYPPVYTQRYAAVTDCLLDTRWRGRLEKVIDFGCNDMSFIKCLKDIPGVREILGVDLEPIPTTLDLKPDKYSQTRENPLKIALYQGNAADPDYRLIGYDAVVSIEMIEHMLPHDLERFVHNVFGFIKPWVVVITTPNGDFNVLFKALESNGLRRLDHMFEWSREQFHDWCANIVSRYPEYSVSCKGIGPGPPGTSHLGCCSQLALFVAADYQKQIELNPDSLAIVDRDPVSAMSDSMDSWDMTESLLENRLNCTNNQVKRFTKTTHQLIAKHNINTLVNAKDVVSEIQHLSKIAKPESQESIWKNINWGEDAPYWNKYYKIVKEYSYPFAAKSDDTRILEAIAEEIDRLIYSSGEEFLLLNDKMELPIAYIMGVVSHITDNEDAVRELLEWNGYEVHGDIVVYTKFVEDDLPADVQKDWIDVDSVSDCSSTDSQSLVMLENVTEPDMLEYDLQLSLDEKIRSIQLLSKRKDISFELERLVCRLVDLVQVARGSELPQPALLLHKLHDLLTATGNAMIKERRNFIGDCKKAIQFSKRYREDQYVTISIGIERACKAENILEKYESIFMSSDSEQSVGNLEYDYDNGLLTHFEWGTLNMSLDVTGPDNKSIVQSYDSFIEELELNEVNYKEIEKVNTTTCTSTEIIDFLQATEHLQKNYNDEKVIVIKSEPPKKKHNNIKKHNHILKHKKYKKIRRFTSFAPGYINCFKNETIQHHQKLKVNKTQHDYSPIRKFIKPIPSSLMNLFNSSQNNIKEVSQECSIGDIEFSDQESLITVKHVEVTNINCTIINVPNNLETRENNEELEVVKSVSCHAQCNIQEDIRPTSLIFLDDINEPSTSDGIRHISENVQCGPDDVIDLLQAQCDNFNLNITPKRHHTELKIKTSITSFRNTIGTNTSNDVFDNLELLYTREHVFEDLEVKECKRDELQEEIKTNRKKTSLSYGKIHVHCFKDRNSEDIVYQGKWRKCIPKNVAKKTPIVIHKRRKEIVVKKKVVITEKGLPNKFSPKVNAEYTRKMLYRIKSLPINVSHKIPENRKVLDPSNEKRNNRQVRLVKPSIGIRPLEISTPVKKFHDTRYVFDIKNYIPAYLKRRLNKRSMDNSLNLNLKIVLNTNSNQGNQLDKIQKYAENSEKAKYKSYLRKFPNYQVYRNEINKEKDLRRAINDKSEKCTSASTSAYVPRSSCSNNLLCRNKTNYSMSYSSERSSSDNYEHETRKNKIRRVRKLNSNKNAKTLMTKFENDELTTKLSQSLKTEKSPDLNCRVELTEASNDLDFSKDEIIKSKQVLETNINTHSANNIQTFKRDQKKLTFNESVKSSEDVHTDSDNYIEEQIRFLIDESLNHIERFTTVDKNDESNKLDQVEDEKETINSDYNSTLTIPRTSSPVNTEIFLEQEVNASKVSIEYSNIDSGVQDVELLSPISVASVITSKFSEYLSADNEFEDFSSLNSNSIFSLSQNYDLKQNLSILDDSVMSEVVSNVPDEDICEELNTVGSEIRVNQENARFEPPDLSQRSSEDTYVSCSTEDNPHIPYWLFESDSEPERFVLPLQDEVEGSEDEVEGSEDEVEGSEDDAQEPQAIGLGAGDGRGIHSASQDTSGRGTSLETTSLESQDTLSVPSSQQSERNEPQDSSDNEPNDPLENTDDTPNLRALTDGDSHEYGLDSETSYSTV